MKTPVLVLLALGFSATALGADKKLTARDAGGLSLGDGKPFETRRLDCKEVRLSWLAGDQLARGPELVTVVRNEGGASGIQFYVDKDGVVTGVKTWSTVGGVTNAQTIPGLPKIDWVECHDSEPIGGIWVEYFDSSRFGP